MKAWLRTTSIRLFLIALLAGLLFVIFTFWPEHRAKQIIKDQNKSSHQSLENMQTAQSLLSNLPSIVAIKSQQPGSFSNYTFIVNTASKKLGNLKIPYSRPSKIIGVEFGGDKYISEVNLAISQIKQRDIDSAKSDLIDAQKFINYQAKLASALTNIIEYNPSVDMTDFKLNSDDTNQRLRLAGSGLDKAASDLKKLEDADESDNLDSLISQINKLQGERNKLAATGDTSVWIKSVGEAQSAIISNRNEFFDKQLSRLLKNFSEDITTLTKTNRIWSQTAVDT